MCDKVTQSNTLLPIGIDKFTNIVLHFCWDNFDLNEETVTGSGTTHSSYGIVIQEQQPLNQEAGITEQSPSSDILYKNTSIATVAPKSKKRSVIYEPEYVKACFVKPKVEPSFIIIKTSVNNPKTEIAAERSDFLWLFLRKNFPSRFPAWKGWLTLTSSDEVAEKKSSIQYMSPINKSINDNNTIQKIINISQNATHEVEQPVTFFTFDLAVAKKAYNIIWQHSSTYHDVFVYLGAFHTTMSYLGALEKLMKGSGFDDIVLESGICASGSINAVISGKHYNRMIYPCTFSINGGT